MSEIRMEDVFELPLSKEVRETKTNSNIYYLVDSKDKVIGSISDFRRFDLIIHAVNSHDGLTDEVARLKKEAITDCAKIGTLEGVNDFNASKIEHLKNDNAKLEKKFEECARGSDRHIFELRDKIRLLEADNAALTRRVEEAEGLISKAIKHRGNPYQPDGPSTEEQVEEEIIYCRMSHWLTAAEPKGGDDD